MHAAEACQIAMTQRRIAIIGAGFSGVALAARLAKGGRSAPTVTLIEKRRRFGPGLAYSTEDPLHLLNVRASNLSVFAEKPDHFQRWLQRRGMKADIALGFVRRALYGDYLEHVLRRSGGIFGSTLKRLRAEVTACRPAADGWTLSTDLGATLHADVVVLALGNPPPASPRALAAAHLAPIDPWDRVSLRKIPRGDVLIVGSGLTAVDVALSLGRRRRQGITYMLSRRGQLPRAHLTSSASPAPRAVDLPLALSESLRILRKEAEASATRGEHWQHVIDRLRARTPELWRRLPVESQQRFLRHLRPWWDAHRHRMAPEIAAELAKLQNEGRLRVLAGEVVAAERDAKIIQVHYRQRGSKVHHRLEVAGAVNCTGASMELNRSQDPLLRQLFADGIVREPGCGLGIDVDADGRVVRPDGGSHRRLFALGPITQGVFWESTAVPEIRVRAAALAAQLSHD